MGPGGAQKQEWLYWRGPASKLLLSSEIDWAHLYGKPAIPSLTYGTVCSLLLMLGMSNIQNFDSL
jgi:hypothetical protein